MKNNSIPLKLCRLLANGEFHSGKQLGELLGMSRTAVNKHISTLKTWGIDIFTVTGKGYCLSAPITLLDEKKINSLLDYERVVMIPVIDSTNQYLFDNIDKLQSGDACIAEYQSAGRGRRGRKWFSPFGTNLYLSLYWCLEQGPAAANGLSLVIGIVMAEVLHQFGAVNVRVKWPNDLYLNDRKLAGILVELIGKTGDAAKIVIGAGINLSMNKSDQSMIDQDWINLQDAEVNIDRNELSATIINQLRKTLPEFERYGLAPFTERWTALDNFINRPVKLLIGNREELGIARGIDSMGGLLLEQNGVIKSHIGGEISLRPQSP